MNLRRVIYALASVPLTVVALSAATVSPLGERGYAALPHPQKIIFTGGDFRLGADWRIETGSGVSAPDVAVESLKEELAARHRLTLAGTPAGGVIRLAVRKDAVKAPAAVAGQAYRMDLSPREILLTGNSANGLFYAVETLVQLIKQQGGELWLPESRIEDWPDLPLRLIYWDDAHHLERFSELKRAIRQAAFFKINGFVIKLEGHFQFRSAPALVEPYALSPRQLQELTDYGLRNYVQVIPYLDAPAHIAFILKHPEYAPLRAFPQSNYELCMTNPDSYKLLFGMYQDLMDANRGGKYFFLSTDEAYYAGMANNSQCDEVSAAKRLGGNGRVLAEFLAKAAAYLHDRGREVFFWGESPLKPADVELLPSYLISAGLKPLLSQAFQRHGIREMVFTSTQGEEKLFPNYFVLPDSRRLSPARNVVERVARQMNEISYDPARKSSQVLGEINCGWADSGLHPETFWLGYATSAAAGWSAGVPGPREAAAMFHLLFYGPGAREMSRVYQLLSMQAQFFQDSWESGSIVRRTPIFGYSSGIFNPPMPVHEPTLPLPQLPDMASKEYGPGWADRNARRLALAQESLSENDELLGLLHANAHRVERNRYNVEVMLAVAELCRQNLETILGIGRMEAQLKQAHALAVAGKSKEALTGLDGALETADAIRRRRNLVLRDAIATWQKSWEPRVPEANGRRYVHQVDDVKDHLPDRTVDMTYLVYRQLTWPFGEWVRKLQTARNHYARSRGLPAGPEGFHWEDLRAGLERVGAGGSRKHAATFPGGRSDRQSDLVQ
ncbi:MAG TPA: beta-N-acetylhexosaminidase [Bryobacteraceae bacterium]|nr:beta-N-acetylhexosaminidase [Bryobacteraceae bacterium]